MPKGAQQSVLDAKRTFQDSDFLNQSLAKRFAIQSWFACNCFNENQSPIRYLD